jgi:uncharacterized protein (DUF2235 family)
MTTSHRQQRTENTDKEKRQKKFLMNYMVAFRETFSRPVRRIRFLGLFDTVNSVPQFENAWLQRSKFPYTARSSAKVIRHAVAIDERRAKFRQDLVGQIRPDKKKKKHHYRRRGRQWDHSLQDEDIAPHEKHSTRGRKPPVAFLEQHESLAPPTGVPRDGDHSQSRSRSPHVYEEDCAASFVTDMSHDSLNLILNRNGHLFDHDSDDDEQDIQETWFAGAHADIGGGWVSCVMKST